MKSLRARIMHFVRHWHARFGVFVAVFFLFLSISGVALNHTDALHMAKTPVHAGWLMRWYGLKPDIPTRGYIFPNGYFAASDERWVLNGKALPGQDMSVMKQVLKGAAAWSGMIAVAGSHDLFLFTPDGQQVDHLVSSMLPGVPLERLGVIPARQGQRLVLKTAQGDFSSSDGLSWEPFSSRSADAQSAVEWAQEQPLPADFSYSLRQSFSPSLPLERIVLDLHSGRIFGHYGPFLMDLTALVLVTLSLSGVWIYIRSVRRRPKR